jgi:hypothetical protein
MKADATYIEIGDRKIVIDGIGKRFYQDGFPISMAVDICRNQGLKVSILHAADECLKNGWSAKTVLTRFRNDFADVGEKLDMGTLVAFCNASYEDQREMIFQYLFNDSEQLARDFATKYFI